MLYVVPARRWWKPKSDWVTGGLLPIHEGSDGVKSPKQSMIKCDEQKQIRAVQRHQPDLPGIRILRGE